MIVSLCVVNLTISPWDWYFCVGPMMKWILRAHFCCVVFSACALDLLRSATQHTLHMNRWTKSTWCTGIQFDWMEWSSGSRLNHHIARCMRHISSHWWHCCCSFFYLILLDQISLSRFVVADFRSIWISFNSKVMWTKYKKRYKAK